MSTAFTLESQVILRHAADFAKFNVLFAGDIQDMLPCYFVAKRVNVQLTVYQRYQQMKDKIKGKMQFGLIPDMSLFDNIDTLIYYWPKTKREAQFRLSCLLHYLSDNANIFIIGENRSGVRSCEKWLAAFGSITKIDIAKRCSLYRFRAEVSIPFDIKYWWNEYSLPNSTLVRALPGVFSIDHLDTGSELLLEVLSKNENIVTGKVLDLGCGAGVLSVAIAKMNPNIDLTLSDTQAAALISSKATLAINHVKGKVVASDVFSDIDNRFDLIISNPPFHDGIGTNYAIVEKLICEARQYLIPGGHLCLVANAFLPYAKLLDKAFGRYQILLQTSKFKVYLATFS